MTCRSGNKFTRLNGTDSAHVNQLSGWRNEIDTGDKTLALLV